MIKDFIIKAFTGIDFKINLYAQLIENIICSFINLNYKRFLVKYSFKSFIVVLKIDYMQLILIIFLSIVLFPPFAQSQSTSLTILWLTDNQNPIGSWGSPTHTEFRDTTVVTDVMKELGATWMAYSSAINFTESVLPTNNDYLSRKASVLAQEGIDVSSLINELISLQNFEEFNDTLFNYPEGGWGVAQGYATNNLDTSLALEALNSAGLAGGLTVTDETIEPGETDYFQFELPEGATSLTITITSLTGEIDFRIKQDSPPTLADPYYHITSAPINLSGLPVEPGTNYIRVDTSVSSTYSFEVSYVANEFDTKSLLAPINYLILAQNLDGGWGISKGSDNNIYITSKVLAILQAYASYFDLEAPIANGIAWLRSQQNPNGGFGESGSTIYETAISYMALAREDRSTSEVEDAYNYIDSQQLANGSWNDDAYDTAMALRIYTILPSSIDSDGDGLSNSYETNITETDPLNTDSDGDGITDDKEDLDSDNLDNYVESVIGTDPKVSDTDMDSMDDGDELTAGRNPLLPELAKIFKKGINLYSYPLEIPPGLTSEQLPAFLGIQGLVQDISRLDPATELFETTDFSTETATGPIFSIVSGDGYLIKMYDTVQGLSSGYFLPPSNINLYQGISLVSFVSPASNLSAYDLLRDIGDETEISSIQAYDPEPDSFKNVNYHDGKPVGPDFQIMAGEAYFVYMKVDKLGWGPPNNPPVANAGPDQVVTPSTLVILDGTGSYDPDTGPDPLTYKWTQLEGSPVILSDDTEIQPTFTTPENSGTLIFTLSVDDGKGESSDSITVIVGIPPDIEITSPSDGETLYSSPVTVIGTIDDNSATVTVNDIPAVVSEGTFSADVPLVEGENTITAIAVNSIGLSDTDTITVTLSTVDYTIPQGGSVDDNRVFTEDAGLISQVVSYSETQIGVPPFITYTTTGVSLISATEIRIDFNIAASPAATLGIHTFQVQYDFYDSGGTKIFTHTFEFKVQII